MEYPIFHGSPDKQDSFLPASIAPSQNPLLCQLCLSKFLPLFTVGLRSSYISSMFLVHPIMFFPLNSLHLVPSFVFIFVSKTRQNSEARNHLLCIFFQHLAHSWVLKRPSSCCLQAIVYSALCLMSDNSLTLCISFLAFFPEWFSIGRREDIPRFKQWKCQNREWYRWSNFHRLWTFQLHKSNLTDLGKTE